MTYYFFPVLIAFPAVDPTLCRLFLVASETSRNKSDSSCFCFIVLRSLCVDAFPEKVSNKIVKADNVSHEVSWGLLWQIEYFDGPWRWQNAGLWQQSCS